MVSRYGGISAGGQLPVLELQAKTIQDVAAQLGRLLNVTGVWLQNSTLCACLYLCAIVCVPITLLLSFVMGPKIFCCRENTRNKR